MLVTERKLRVEDVRKKSEGAVRTLVNGSKVRCAKSIDGVLLPVFLHGCKTQVFLGRNK